jgi:hypothetical protein
MIDIPRFHPFLIHPFAIKRDLSIYPVHQLAEPFALDLDELLSLHRLIVGIPNHALLPGSDILRFGTDGMVW